MTVEVNLAIRNVPMHLRNSTTKKMIPRFLIDISHVLRVALVIQMKLSIRFKNAHKRVHSHKMYKLINISITQLHKSMIVKTELLLSVLAGMMIVKRFRGFMMPA